MSISIAFVIGATPDAYQLSGLEDKYGKVYYFDIQNKEETETMRYLDFNDEKCLEKLVQQYENTADYIIFDYHVVHFITYLNVTLPYLLKLLKKEKKWLLPLLEDLSK